LYCGEGGTEKIYTILGVIIYTCSANHLPLCKKIKTCSNQNTILVTMCFKALPPLVSEIILKQSRGLIYFCRGLWKTFGRSTLPFQAGCVKVMTVYLKGAAPWWRAAVSRSPFPRGHSPPFPWLTYTDKIYKMRIKTVS
jgi:hypothetical protein